ncbi:MAG: hypothetical protein Kow0020_04670 [Wenzhouxiangellaceae bacterium]
MKNRIVVTTVILLFAAPLLVAVILNSRWVDWEPEPRRAHGQLFRPALALPAFSVKDHSGTHRTREDLTGRWQLIVSVPFACTADCVALARLAHNIRLAQDRHALKVGLLLISSERLDPATAQTIADMDAHWMIFHGNDGAALLSHLPDSGTGAFYILDPDANIIERFDLDADPTGIRKDLDRLLTWSRRD